MMLQALYSLAREQGWLEDPDYEEHAVHFLLRVDDEGRPLSLESTIDEQDRAKALRIPRLPRRTSGVSAGLLVDNAKYILGLGDPEAEKPERLRQCMEAFQERVAELAQATGDPGVRAVLCFLEARDQWLSRLLAWRPREEWGGDEYIAFIYAPDEVRCVHEREPVRAWWKAAREREEQNGESSRVRCLITGELAPPARLHGGAAPHRSQMPHRSRPGPLGGEVVDETFPGPLGDTDDASRRRGPTRPHRGECSGGSGPEPRHRGPGCPTSSNRCAATMLRLRAPCRRRCWRPATR